MEQIERRYTSGEVSRNANPLTLYDQYGSMAYGVILKIIPEPELAQTVLVDLFASPQLRSSSEASMPTATDIIRLARAKALASRAVSLDSYRPTAAPNENKAVEAEKLVFDLSFCQGYTLEEIAQQLRISHQSALKFIHTYFKQLRSS